MITEVFAFIPGYSNGYMVSSLGRVLSFKIEREAEVHIERNQAKQRAVPVDARQVRRGAGGEGEVMVEDPFYLEGKEFIFEYGKVELLPFDRLRKDEHGRTVASEQKAYRRERVVRCRDCVHGKAVEQIGCLLLDWHESVERPHNPDGFCAWGRRDDGD